MGIIATARTDASADFAVAQFKAFADALPEPALAPVDPAL